MAAAKTYEKRKSCEAIKALFKYVKEEEVLFDADLLVEESDMFDRFLNIVMKCKTLHFFTIVFKDSFTLFALNFKHNITYGTHSQSFNVPIHHTIFCFRIENEIDRYTRFG